MSNKVLSMRIKSLKGMRCSHDSYASTNGWLAGWRLREDGEGGRAGERESVDGLEENEKGSEFWKVG